MRSFTPRTKSSQAANEELETSREELQSLNEELTTVNAQLQTKIEDEEETNNDLNNFLASTNIPTIFLDHRLRVKRFTPAMARLIKLLPGDVGRPIIDMSQAYLGLDLVSDAQSVLNNLTPVTRELGIANAWYVRNILPYRTSDNRIEGVVITYTDITDRKRQEEETGILLTAVQEEKDRLSALINSIGDEVWFADTDKTFTLTNPSALREFGFGAADGIDVEKMAASLEVYRPDGTPRPVEEAPPLRALKGEVVKNQEEIVRTPASGELRHRQVSAAPVRNGDGHIIGSVSVVRDITEQKQAEEAVWESRAKLQAALASMTDAVFISDIEGNFVEFNDAFATFHRFPNKDACWRAFAKYEEIFEGFLPDGRLALPDMWPVSRGLRGESGTNAEMAVRRKDTGEVWVGSYSFGPIRDKDGAIVGSVVVARDVTEQKRAEEALRLSEEKFAVAFANNPAAIAMTRFEDGLFLEVNDTWVAMNGHSREEVIGRSARTMHIWPTTEASTRFVQELQEKASLRGWEQEFLKKSGEVFVAQLSAQTLALGGEKVILSTFVDITERKRAEERLRISEEHYRSLFDNMLNGYAYCKMLFDENGPQDFTYLSVNSAFESLTGLKNVTGKNVSEVIPGIRQSDPELFEIYGRVALTGTPERFETYVEALDMWFSIAVYSPAKEYFVAIFDVITERKRAEEALRRSHDELEERVIERTEALRRQADLLELAYDAIIVRDLDGKAIFWNARAREVYGFTREEALGQMTHTLLQTKFPVPLEEHMAVLTTQGRWEGELTHTTKDGRHIVVLSRQALQRDETGNPVAIMEISLDVTEERRVEEHLRQAQKMEALGTLSGGIAHDFNNILAAVIGFTELVAGHVGHESRDAHALERVMEAAIRGRELVRQMLTFSRKTEHEKKPVRMSDIVRESVRLLRAAVPSSIAIKLDVTSESGFILADPVQIQQVLMNLCTNAAHAIREKGGTLDIKLDDFSVGSSGNDFGIAPGPYMRLLVRDTGVGMSPDIMARVFDPFFTTKGLGEGTGLGLSVVHGIVKQHDGHITVISEPGKGSTFTVYIPQIPEELETDAVSDDDLPTGSERILFVDDEEALVEMAEDILAELGYEVTSRMNGREALELLKSDPSRFDLVITDQTMPEMTGIDLAREIFSLRPNMPIIMCTGFSYLVDADKALAAGIKAFAMKPLTKREIARTIRNVLDE